MITVLEIESAVKELPIHEVQEFAQWLQNYVGLRWTPENRASG